VSAIDRDLDPFNKFIYAGIRYRNSTSGCASTTGNRKPPPFRLDPITGAITTTESLDREKCAVYEITIRAAVSPSLDSANTISGSGSSCNAVIYVTDANDNRPTFDFPKIGNDHMVISLPFILSYFIFYDQGVTWPHCNGRCKWRRFAEFGFINWRFDFVSFASLAYLEAFAYDRPIQNARTKRTYQGCRPRDLILVSRKRSSLHYFF